MTAYLSSKRCFSTALRRACSSSKRCFTVAKLRSASSSFPCGSSLLPPVSRFPRFAREHLFLSIRAFSTSYPPHEVVGLPALSPTMTTGTLISWGKQEGDKVAPGDIICQVETDKTVVEYEAQDEFYMAKHLVPEKQGNITIGDPIFVHVEEPDFVAAFKEFVVSAKDTSPSPPLPPSPTIAAPIATPAPVVAAPSDASTPCPLARGAVVGDRLFASPLARKTARERTITLQGIQGTGPNGRILQGDVLKAIESGATASAAANEMNEETPLSASAISVLSQTGDYVDLLLSPEAQRRAEELRQQKLEVPHYHLSVELSLDRLLQAREQLNTAHQEEFSVNDFIIRAVCSAMQRVPVANSAYMGTFIRQFKDTNVGVSLMAEGGTVVPVIKAANRKGLRDIHEEMKQMMEKAEKGEISPEETAGATVTVTNMGMYNLSSFAGIVGKGQSCVLGLGTIEKRVIPNEAPNAEQLYKYATMMTATLACDHRVLDGAVGAEFLTTLQLLVEEPLNNLL